MSYNRYNKHPRKYRRYYNRNQFSFEDAISRFIALILLFPLLAIIPYYVKFVEYLFAHPYSAIWIGIALLSMYGIFSYFLIKYKKNLEQRRLLSYSRYKDILKINWREFEKYIEALLKNDGYKTELWPWRNDWGVDITAEKENRRYLIQCKHYGNEQKVTVPQVREFYGVMNHIDSIAKWIYVTTWELTHEAIEFCKQEDIEVWDKHFFLEFLRENELKIENESNDFWVCDKCGWKLLLRTAKNGQNSWHQFLWCENYPNCGFTKSI
mgnify:CR=1 FL=1